MDDLKEIFHDDDDRVPGTDRPELVCVSMYAARFFFTAYVTSLN